MSIRTVTQIKIIFDTDYDLTLNKKAILYPSDVVDIHDNTFVVDEFKFRHVGPKYYFEFKVPTTCKSTIYKFVIAYLWKIQGMFTTNKEYVFQDVSESIITYISKLNEFNKDFESKMIMTGNQTLSIDFKQIKRY